MKSILLVVVAFLALFEKEELRLCHFFEKEIKFAQVSLVKHPVYPINKKGMSALLFFF